MDFLVQKIATEIMKTQETLKGVSNSITTLYLNGYINGLTFLLNNHDKEAILAAKLNEISTTIAAIHGDFRNQLIGFLDGLNFK